MNPKRAGMPARGIVPVTRASRADGRTKRTRRFVLVLYVAGVDRKSTEAIAAITRLCDEHLEGRYQLGIVDIYQQPALAREEQIIAAPTLIIKRPLPSRRLVGSMEDLEKVLVGLEGMPRS